MHAWKHMQGVARNGMGRCAPRALCMPIASDPIASGHTLRSPASAMRSSLLGFWHGMIESPGVVPPPAL